MNPRLRGLCLKIFGLLILSSCGSIPVINNTVSQQNTLLAQKLTREEINKLLQKANNSNGSERTHYLLEAADAMLKQNELDWAKNTLSQVFEGGLDDPQFILYSLLSSELAQQEGNPYIAKRYLWDSRLTDSIPSQPTNSQIRIRHKRADILFDISEYADCIAERILLHGLLDDINENELNQDLTWAALMAFSNEELDELERQQTTYLAQGWYRLALVNRNTQTNLQEQLTAVENWQFRWTDHPASTRLPADLQLIQQLVAELPQEIALLLPLSGQYSQYGQATLKGFMAAYYRSRGGINTANNGPNIKILDTSQANIDVLYDTAIANGAQMVVGPLIKEKIETLTLRPELPVPTLALNILDDTLNLPMGLFQFGLKMEDEAIQVAARAWKDGHRRVLVIAPENRTGDRSVAAFREHWESIGGAVVGDYRFRLGSNYSKSVERALDVAASRSRKTYLQRVIGAQTEFEPRRRKDIDFIYLVSAPREARQIKPTLAFHYAGKVPVYSTSHIFDGHLNNKQNKDLSGIQFTTIPWFVDSELQEKQLMDGVNATNTALQEFHAFGVDAFHLYPRLRQLSEVKQANFYGATGRLSVDENRKVHREQPWAQFRRSQVMLVPRIQDIPEEGENALDSDVSPFEYSPQLNE